MDYSTDAFFEKLYTDKMNRVAGEPPADKKTRLRAVMGIDKLDALDFVPPEWRLIESSDADGYRAEQFVMEPLPLLKMPVYVLTPVNYSMTFIYCHGHGVGAVEALEKPDEYQRSLPVTLARAGYRVIVPELMGFNRVVQKEFNMEYERGCFINSVRLLMFGLTMTAVRVRQAMEAVSYAAKDDKTLPVVGGISGGGLTTAYTAALYNDRMRGAFISGYVNTFRASIMPLYCCVDNYIPDILSVGEEPDIIALACPLPLLISSGTDDPIFPVAASLKAADSIKSVYAKSGAESNITLEVFNGGHEMSTAALMPWLAEMAGT